VYRVASEAYKDLQAKGRPQCVIITGEVGVWVCAIVSLQPVLLCRVSSTARAVIGWPVIR
jgi:hypothetical protein